jgi:hypothetical protein
MEPQEIANLYSTHDGHNDAVAYLSEQGLLELVEAGSSDPKRFAPDYRDLARLHRVIRQRKVFSILEFGLGYSTLVMADALSKNRLDWDRLAEKPRIRNTSLFDLYSVDTSESWIRRTEAMLPDKLRPIIHICHSQAVAGTFHDRACHYYEHVPNIVPDLVYLDGPDPTDVGGSIRGLAWTNSNRVVMAADILSIEPLLLPGTLVVADGRVANVRFITSHFYRNWNVAQAAAGDVTVMELQEAPLGENNHDALVFCLGTRVEGWA